ncbi:FliH/SctL family protein [Thalassomonas actiniarum]|uniref:Flagellar assembly protein FliH n=1 Tax=Thalassomonas actiniarum TaxID=485447 RepID=A0AAE9YVX2_9GAMM|nr:FliH/SctL family protein [Thalassomonas actiniarum]WDE02246.1 hypothetical protein SG35_031310 [Thalassomonas actiniarum]
MFSVIQLKNGTLENKPSGNLLKKSDYRTYMDHKRLAAYSKQQVKKRHKSADARMAEQEEKGYQAGLKAGKAESRQQLLALNLKSIEYIKTFERQACEIIQDVLQRILGQIDQSTLIQSLVGTAIKAVETEQQIKVIVSSNDVKAVKARVEHWQEQYPNIERIDVIADSKIPVRSCRLETPVGVVDAGLQTQLNALHKSLGAVFGSLEGQQENENKSIENRELSYG